MTVSLGQEIVRSGQEHVPELSEGPPVAIFSVEGAGVPSLPSEGVSGKVGGRWVEDAGDEGPARGRGRDESTDAQGGDGRRQRLAER